MKPIKVASLVLMATLAMGSYSIAQVITRPEFMALNVSMIVEKQELIVTNKNGDGKTYVSTTGKQKLNNKALLALMAEMFNTNWPEGARLMYATYDEQPVVTDQTGTNVLFYCGNGVNDAYRYSYVSLDFFHDQGPFRAKNVEADSSWVKSTGNWRGVISIYCENHVDEAGYINLSGDGLNIENCYDKWNDITIATSAEESFAPFALGDTYDGMVMMTGKITAKGKGIISVPGGGSGGLIIGLPPQ
jgi:hypothetical protein